MKTDKVYVVNGLRTFLVNAKVENSIEKTLLGACVDWIDTILSRNKNIDLDAYFDADAFCVDDRGFRPCYGVTQLDDMPLVMFDIEEIMDAYDEKMRFYDPFCQFDTTQNRATDAAFDDCEDDENNDFNF